MKRLALLLVVLGLAGMGLGWNAERLLLFHFDPTRVAPAEVGLTGVAEVEREGLVLWVAEPAPGMPTILYFHGNAGNLAVRAGRFRAFTQRGYGLVAMAYPGSSGSIGPATTEAFARQAADLYRALPSLVGPGPIVLYGESLGTGIATYVAASTAADPVKGIGPPAALVLESPYTSIREVAAALYGLPAGAVAYLPNALPSRDWIATVTAPLLVLHGSEDRVVPHALGRALFEAAPSNDKDFVLVAGAGHENVWQPDAQRRLYAFLGRF